MICLNHDVGPWIEENVKGIPICRTRDHKLLLRLDGPPTTEPYDLLLTVNTGIFLDVKPGLLLCDSILMIKTVEAGPVNAPTIICESDFIWTPTFTFRERSGPLGWNEILLRKPSGSLVRQPWANYGTANMAAAFGGMTIPEAAPAGGF